MKGQMKKLHIDFDGSQVTVITDVLEISEALGHHFKYMLTDAVSNGAGRIVVKSAPSGFAIETMAGRGLREVTVGQIVEELKNEVHVQFMRTRPDLMWLHAAGVRREGRVLLLCGESGQGKSTLAYLLRDMGWRFLADDVVAVTRDEAYCIPFPKVAKRRIDPGKRIPGSDINRLAAEEIDLGLVTSEVEAAPVSHLVFISFEHGVTPSLSRLSPGETALRAITSMSNFCDLKEVAVTAAAAQAQRIPGYSLVYGISTEAAAVLNELS